MENETPLVGSESVQPQNEEILTPVEAKPGFLKRLNKKWLAVAAIVLVAGGAAYYFKGFFFAASVNGSLISRWSVIRELEKGTGKQAVDYLITQKLIQNELDKNKVQVSNGDVDKKIGEISRNIESQGSTLAAALALQGMTDLQFRDQVTTQTRIEKLLADKITVTDAEIDSYIKDNKISFAKGADVAVERAKIKDQIWRQKFSQVANAWVSDLRAKATIKYLVDYK